MNPTVLAYPDLVGVVRRWLGLEPDDARAVTAATITAFARVLDASDRHRLLSLVPAEVRDTMLPAYHENRPVDLPYHRRTGSCFLVAVACVEHQTLPVAGRRAQVVLARVAECAPGLIASFDLPSGVPAVLRPLRGLEHELPLDHPRPLMPSLAGRGWRSTAGFRRI